MGPLYNYMDNNHTEHSEEVIIPTPTLGWRRMLNLAPHQESISPEQELFFKNHFNSVGRLIKPFFHFDETRQISFILTLIKYNYNKDQIRKLIPVLNPLIENLEPVSIHKDVKDKFVVIPVLDQEKGGNGSVSILIRKKPTGWEACLYAESKTLPFQLSGWQSFEKTLILAAKKHYFFG